MEQARAVGQRCAALSTRTKLAAGLVGVVLLAVVVASVSGGGGGGTGGSCAWSLAELKAGSGSGGWGGTAPKVAPDGQAASCDDDGCIVVGARIPWQNPWRDIKLDKDGYAHPGAAEACAGTYSYTVRVAECGTAGLNGWNNRAGFVGDSGVSTDALGLDLWASLESDSCYHGWLCGCKGTVADEANPPAVTGGLRLDVSVDTEAWKLTIVSTPPPGAKALHSDSPTQLPVLTPVPAKTVVRDLVPNRKQQCGSYGLLPTLLLGRGAEVRLAASVVQA